VKTVIALFPVFCLTVACVHDAARENKSDALAGVAPRKSLEKGIPGIDASVFASCQKTSEDRKAIRLACAKARLKLCIEESLCMTTSLLDELAQDQLTGDGKRSYVSKEASEEVIIGFEKYTLNSKRERLYSSAAQETGTTDYVKFVDQRDGIISATCTADSADTPVCEHMLLHIAYIGLPPAVAPAPATDAQTK